MWTLSSKRGACTKRLASLAVLTCVVFTQTAWGQAATEETGSAQEKKPGRIDVVTVTAEKRETTLQTTPLSVSAFTSDGVGRLNAANTEDLQFSIPNFNFSAFKADSRITIRGVSNGNLTIGGDPGVAFHQDGVYLTRGGLTNNEFFDIERIEVLRGPQGTIYGRNAVGGVVNVITAKPTDVFEGHGDVLYGSWNRLRIRGAVNIPIAEGFAARIAAVSDEHEGYVTNVFDGEKLSDRNFTGIRGHLQYSPEPGHSYLLTVVHERSDGTGIIRKLLEPNPSPELAGQGPEPTDPYEVNHNDIDQEIVNRFGISFTAQIPLGFAELKSISAYNRSRVFQFLDLDDTDVDFVKVSRDDRDRTFTQELQLTGNVGEDWDWIFGLFYMDSNVFNDVPFEIVPVGTLLLFADQELRAYAAFAQATYSVTDRLRLTAGLRYSYEKKLATETNDSFGDIVSRQTRFSDNAWTPRFVIQYDVTDEIMGYASVTRGFKSGGFNMSSFVPPYDSEFIWSYEAGIKSTWFDRRLQFNLSGFYYDYSDLQTSVRQPGDLVFTIRNAANAKIHGVEVEITALPIKNLELSFALGYIKGTYDELLTADATRPELGILDLSGNNIPRTPRFKGSLGAEYWIDLVNVGSLTLRMDLNFQDKVYFLPFNVAPYLEGGYAKLNFSVTYESADGRWSAKAFFRNVTDKATISEAIPGLITTVPSAQAFYDPPAHWGISIGHRF